jgi:hypothetical protein
MRSSVFCILASDKHCVLSPSMAELSCRWFFYADSPDASTSLERVTLALITILSADRLGEWFPQPRVRSVSCLKPMKGAVLSKSSTCG